MPQGGRRRSGERGQALAEFAVLAPLLLLILMATIGFGHLLFTRMVVVQAANRAARLGATLYGDSDVSRSEAYHRTRSAAEAVLAAALKGTDRSVDVTTAGDDIRVTVRYRSTVAVPFLERWLGGGVWVEHSSVYRIERDTA